MLKRKLRIAQLVLPWIKIPPPRYAGTERIVYNLTEALVKKGHDVTLFSVGESKTSAKLKFVFKKAFGLQPDVMKTLKSSFYPWIHVANCFEQQDQFDIIHSHAQFLGLPFAAIAKTPTLHTFHRVYEFASKDERDLISRYGKKLYFTSISNSQRIPGINFVSTVYNGINTNKFRPVKSPKRNFLFWAGRIIEKKGPREAIKIAKALKYPLIMAGKITEPEYFEKYIKNEIDGNLIKLVGEIDEDEMINYFQQAKLTLVPIKWNEPFGLIPVESMACGTPVVAYANGGVKETVVDGKTGFLVAPSIKAEKNPHYTIKTPGLQGLIEATKRIYQMDNPSYKRLRINARQRVEENFTISKMVEEYEKIYLKILK